MTTISTAEVNANQSSGAGGRRVAHAAASWAATANTSTVIASAITAPEVRDFGVPSIELKRIQAAVRVLILASWATTTSLTKRPGAVITNGRTGIRKPAATPQAKVAARLSCGRQSAASTITGTIAHTLTAPPKPNATPPQASRRVLAVIRSRSKTATAPARQNSTSQGSSSTVRADTAEGG